MPLNGLAVRLVLRFGALRLLLSPSFAAGFEAVPCNATTLDCGINFFREVYIQFQQVQDEVVIMPYFIKPDLHLFSSVEGGPADTTLTDLIQQAVKRRIHVWIMGWDNAASEKFLPFHQDGVYEKLFEAVGEDHHYLHLTLDTSRNFIASVYYIPHIKSYVFDRRVAYVGGLDFAENRLDSPQHVRPDPRLVRVPVDENHVTGNEKPWQDVMVKVDGAAAEHVAMVLVERWWTYCKSEGYLRSQATRPLDAIADAVWGVHKSLRASRWKGYQCAMLPKSGRLGTLVVEVSLDSLGRSPSPIEVTVPNLKLQSLGLPIGHDLKHKVLPGAPHEIAVTGLRGLDRQLPDQIDVTVGGVTVVARSERDTSVDFPDGFRLRARWYPNGQVAPQPGVQSCQIVLSGDRDWMGVTNPLTENYETHVKMIREAKRFIFIENQYFSTTFASVSHECSNGNVRGRAVLYTGATNRVGEELLKRIKDAGLRGENFAVVVIIPLGTEPGSFYPNLRGTFCFEQAVEDFWKEAGLKSDWRDYFAFYFLANAVAAPEAAGGPGTAFYGVFMHTKVIVVDDEVALVGSANINDRSLNGDRDAEVGVTISGGTYPKQLRETLLKAHVGNISLIDPNHLAKSLNAVAMANADALYKSTGISFPKGTFTSKSGETQRLFGLKGVKVVKVPIETDEDQDATLPYPLSREVAGGGGMDAFKWFVVPSAHPPQLHGLIFPWSRDIWGLPKMTQVTQMFSNSFNWRRLSLQKNGGVDENASSALLV